MCITSKVQRWLWHTIDHMSGALLAYVIVRRKDEVFLHLKTLLEPFRTRRFYIDGWGVYGRHLEPGASDAHIQAAFREGLNSSGVGLVIVPLDRKAA